MGCFRNLFCCNDNNDTILWFLILFLLLFNNGCGCNCGNDCGCNNSCGCGNQS